jgi:thiopurine S-methyltransferase
MEPDFWHSRWEQGQIGFHLATVNPRLIAHASALPAAPGSRVLVPLCGKTLDMAWLAARGHQVVGVELSELAAQAFMQEHGLLSSLVVVRDGAFVCYRTPGIEIWCADMLSISRAQLGHLDGYYDRAALVALPETMRVPYLQQLATLLPRGARGLVISFDYAQAQMPGPPFSVDDATVRALYTQDFEPSALASYDVLSEEPRFRAAGLSSLHERVYGVLRR